MKKKIFISFLIYILISATFASSTLIKTDCNIDISKDSLWSEAEVLSTDSYFGCDAHSMCIAPDNTVHVVYFDQITNENNTRISRLNYATVNSNYKTRETIFQGFCMFVYYTSINVDSNGIIHIVYTRNDPDDYDDDIYHRSKTKNGVWSNEELIFSNDKGEHINGLTSAIGPDNTIHVTWIEGYKSESVLKYTNNRNNGEWKNPEEVRSNAIDIENPSIDVDFSSKIHLAWAEYEHIYYSFKSSHGSWSNAQKISVDENIYSADQPCLKTDLEGNVHVVWYTNKNGDIYYITYCMKDSNSVWDNHEYLTDINIDNYAYQPHLAIDKTGIVHVVFRQWYGSYDEDIVYTQKSIEGSWSSFEVVSSETNDFVSTPTIQTDSNNYIHVVWVDGGDYKEAADDEMGEESDIFYKYRTPGVIDNNPPTAPEITGKQNGELFIPYTYRFKSEDFDGDQIYYKISWGDGTSSEYLGPYSSGTEISESHSWILDGAYVIKCKAIDDPNGDGDLSDGLESKWGTLPVTMPKSKYIHFSMLARFLAKFFIIFSTN